MEGVGGGQVRLGVRALCSTCSGMATKHISKAGMVELQDGERCTYLSLSLSPTPSLHSLLSIRHISSLIAMKALAVDTPALSFLLAMLNESDALLSFSHSLSPSLFLHGGEFKEMYYYSNNLRHL